MRLQQLVRELEVESDKPSSSLTGRIAQHGRQDLEGLEILLNDQSCTIMAQMPAISIVTTLSSEGLCSIRAAAARLQNGFGAAINELRGLVVRVRRQGIGVIVGARMRLSDMRMYLGLHINQGALGRSVRRGSVSRLSEYFGIAYANIEICIYLHIFRYALLYQLPPQHMHMHKGALGPGTKAMAQKRAHRARDPRFVSAIAVVVVAVA